MSSLHFEHSALRLHFEYSIFTKSLHFLHRNFVFSTLQPASTRYLQSGCCRGSYVSALLLTLLGLVVQRVRGARAVLLCRGRCQCTFLYGANGRGCTQRGYLRRCTLALHPSCWFNSAALLWPVPF